MDTKTTSIGELATKVGYVFQNPNHQIFSRTVRDELAFGPKNLGLPSDEIERRVNKVAQTLGLTGLLDYNPFDLSLGTRQKIAVGSILTMEPDVVIVDEPTTGQDHRTSREMMNLFSSLNKAGKTIIVITHNMNLAAEYARRVIVLKDGEIVADGPTRNVFSNIEILEKAYLMPPQITRLALKLREFGAPVALSVEEMAEFLINKLRN
jgi:energy-coupling factor transport system ATP-binding protein